MDCKPYPFEKLPFSQLFHDYIHQSDSLSSFFPAHPFDEASAASHANSHEFTGDRDETADLLLNLNQAFGAGKATLDQIEKLRSGNSLAVVTGQQLTIYGGPLFTIYKTLTAIIYARRWEEKLDRPVVPVFWMADEDHDFEEVSRLGILTDRVYQELQMENGQDHSLPAGRYQLGKEFAGVRKQLRELLPDSDFSDSLFESLDRHYQDKRTLQDAFGGWMMELFGKYGLILAGSDDPEIKKRTLRPLLKATENHQEVMELLDVQSKKLEGNGFHRQARVQSSNIFYIDEKQRRQKLVFEDSSWYSGNGHRWSTDELTRNIESTPEQFSPNVFLRPLMQDHLLPTLAYVAGPGETAYYAQMKPLYENMEQRMPMILPRFSLTLIEPAIQRVMKKLPFELSDYARRIEDLESGYIEKIDRMDVEEVFADWKNQVHSITREKTDEIGQVDPTLKASVDKAGTIFENELNKLKGKVYRAIKKDEEIQLNRIRRIRHNLFPDSKLQERQVAFICYMNKYGPDVWDRLFQCLENHVPDTHIIVDL
ncbi:MAG: bacillithiol biosynthesis cysteine-adding enzyme BshC [Balneolaceae bacterium]